ncbi:hypothetical protein QCQ72_005092 [Bacillus cereus]|nr:hypothetical protein [Bacillus cereus]
MNKTSVEKEYISKTLKNYKIIKELKGSSAAEIYVVEHQNQYKVLKIACTKGIDNGNDKLRGEIDFFLNIPVDVRDRFAEVYEYNVVGENVWYTMPFYKEYKTLKEHILEGKDCHKIIVNIMDFMFSKLYTNYFSIGDSKEHNLNRINMRIKETIKLNNSFQDLIDSNRIIINDKSYMNYKEVLEKLEQKFPEIFTNNITMLIHKDLAIENILVSEDLSTFKLIDPRGPGNKKDFADYTYDLAKYSYSLNGFTAIKDNEFELVEINHSHFSFQFNRNFQIKFDKAYKDSILVLENKILSYFDIDKYWMERLYLTEACNFLATVPCFLYKSVDSHKGTALYLQGIILLNNLYEKIHENKRGFLTVK